MLRNKILNNPIIAIIMFIIVFIVFQIPSGIISAIFPGSIAVGISYIIMAFIAIYWYNRYFKKSGFNGLINCNFKGLIYLIPLIIYIVICLIVDGFSMPVLNMVLLSTLLFAIGGAIMEEVIFRGMIVSNFMISLKSKNKIIITFLVSGVLFSIIHIFNAIGGADLGMTIVQVIVALSAGCYFAAIYLRTGNLWIPIIGHSLNNTIATFSSSTNSFGLMVETVAMSDIIMVVISFCLLIFSIYLIRKSKHGEITSLWEDKWSNN